MGIPDCASSYALSVRYDSAGGEDGTSEIVNPNSEFLNQRLLVRRVQSIDKEIPDHYRDCATFDLRIKNDE